MSQPLGAKALPLCVGCGGQVRPIKEVKTMGGDVYHLDCYNRFLDEKLKAECPECRQMMANKKNLVRHRFVKHGVDDG